MFVADNQLEARACEVWRRHGLEPNFDAEALVDALDLGLLWDTLDDAGDAKVFGALVPGEEMVVLNERHRALLEEKPGLRRFTLAHEIGHWLFHVTRDQGRFFFTDGGRKVLCRERSKHPREVQAERFAAFLLTPTELLRPHISGRTWSGWRYVYDLAAIFGTTPTAMIVRLETAGWAHRDAEGIPVSGPRPRAGQPSLFDS